MTTLASKRQEFSQDNIDGDKLSAIPRNQFQREDKSHNENQLSSLQHSTDTSLPHRLSHLKENRDHNPSSTHEMHPQQFAGSMMPYYGPNFYVPMEGTLHHHGQGVHHHHHEGPHSHHLFDSSMFNGNHHHHHSQQGPHHHQQQQPFHPPHSHYYPHYHPQYQHQVTSRITDHAFKMEEEDLSKKHYIRSHRLLPVVMELVATCKKEGHIPFIPRNSQHVNSMDFSLEGFLTTQGIDPNAHNEEGMDDDDEHMEFVIKFEHLKSRYNEELEKLNQVSSEFCGKMLITLREQSTIRPIGEAEIQEKLSSIQHKFDYVRNQLKQNVCSAIASLQKQYNQAAKKKRTLPKKASDMLTQWFYEHIHDPYPSEEEKSVMASTYGLTMVQINNWFGNKRIRYKRKCMEQQHGRGKDETPEDKSEIVDVKSENTSSSNNV